MIDRFLRNNLDDDDYAEYSAALDSLSAAPKQDGLRKAAQMALECWDVEGLLTDAVVEALREALR